MNAHEVVQPLGLEVLQTEHLFQISLRHVPQVAHARQTCIAQILRALVADVRFRHHPVERQRFDRVHLEFRERLAVPRNSFVSVGRFLNFAARSTRFRVSDAVVTASTWETDSVPAGRIASTSAARRLARESFVGGREDGVERRRPNLELLP